MSLLTYCRQNKAPPFQAQKNAPALCRGPCSPLEGGPIEGLCMAGPAQRERCSPLRSPRRCRRWILCLLIGRLVRPTLVVRGDLMRVTSLTGRLHFAVSQNPTYPSFCRPLYLCRALLDDRLLPDFLTLIEHGLSSIVTVPHGLPRISTISEGKTVAWTNACVHRHGICSVSRRSTSRMKAIIRLILSTTGATGPHGSTQFSHW